MKRGCEKHQHQPCPLLLRAFLKSMTGGTIEDAAAISWPISAETCDAVLNGKKEESSS